MEGVIDYNVVFPGRDLRDRLITSHAQDVGMMD